jgi:hypothetical protein
VDPSGVGRQLGRRLLSPSEGVPGVGRCGDRPGQLRGEDRGAPGPVCYVPDSHGTGGPMSARVQGSQGTLLRVFHHGGTPGLRTPSTQGGLYPAWREA